MVKDGSVKVSTEQSSLRKETTRHFRQRRMSYMLVGHLPELVLISLVCAGLAIGFCRFFVVAKYEATETVYITEDSDHPKQEIVDFAQITCTKSIIDVVIYYNNMQEEEDYESFLKKLSILQDENSKMVTVRYVDRDPYRARRVVSSVISEAFSLVNQLGDMHAEIVEQPTVTEKPINKNYVLYGVVGFLTAAMVGILFFLVKALTDKNIYDEDDVMYYLGLPVLATFGEDEAEGKGGSHAERTAD